MLLRQPEALAKHKKRLEDNSKGTVKFKRFSQKEKLDIMRYRDEGKPVSYIAKKTGRSCYSLYTFFRKVKLGKIIL